MGASKRRFLEEAERAQYLHSLVTRATPREIISALQKLDDEQKNYESKVRGITPTSED